MKGLVTFIDILVPNMWTMWRLQKKFYRNITKVKTSQLTMFSRASGFTRKLDFAEIIKARLTAIRSTARHD